MVLVPRNYPLIANVSLVRREKRKHPVTKYILWAVSGAHTKGAFLHGASRNYCTTDCLQIQDQFLAHIPRDLEQRDCGKAPYTTAMLPSEIASGAADFAVAHAKSEAGLHLPE